MCINIHLVVLAGVWAGIDFVGWHFNTDNGTRKQKPGRRGKKRQTLGMQNAKHCAKILSVYKFNMRKEILVIKRPQRQLKR